MQLQQQQQAKQMAQNQMTTSQLGQCSTCASLLLAYPRGRLYRACSLARNVMFPLCMITHARKTRQLLLVPARRLQLVTKQAGKEGGLLLKGQQMLL
jgi:hypothetical protein